MRLSWLRELWEEDYPDLFPRFFSCMKEFELCYPLDDAPDVALVPLRFPERKPEIPWSEGDGVLERRIEYRFTGPPPAGLMSRFIVKAHHMIAKRNPDDRSDPGVYWRHGVFLRESSSPLPAEAMCELDTEARLVRITVRSAYPQNFIEKLDGLLWTVFAFFQGFRTERYFGCVLGDDDSEDACTNAHLEDDVLFHLQKGRSILCTPGRHEIGALKLIGGFHSFAERSDLRETLREELDREPEWAEKFGEAFGRALSSVLPRLESIDRMLVENKDHSEAMLARIQEMFQLNHRDLLAVLDDREHNRTPAIFTVVPARTPDWKKPFQSKYRLRFYCEHDTPHASQYKNTFSMTKNWWRKTAPFLSIGLRALSVLANPAFAAVPLLTGKDTWESIRDEIGLAKATVGAIPSSADRGEDSFLSHLKGERRYSGHLRSYDLGEHGPLRERLDRARLSRAMKELDADSHEAGVWGDLERIRMPDGSHRWLCPTHAARYLDPEIED